MYCEPIEVRSGAYSIVPARALLALDLRHGSKAHLDDRRDTLFEPSEGLAQDQGLTPERQLVSRLIAAPLNESVIQKSP